MVNEVRRIEPPEGSLSDTLTEAGVRAVNSVTCGFGGLVLDKLAPSSYQLRKNRFEQDVAAGINQLAENGMVDRKQIEKHEQFFSNYAEAVMAVVRTHDAEKRTMLRNAVLNSLLPEAPDDVEQQIFLACINDLTTLHVRVLKYFSEEKPASLNARDRLIAHFLSEEFGGVIAGDRQMRELIIHDLVGKGLLSERATPNRSWPVQMDNMEKLSTKMGDRFVAFVAEPLP